MNRPLKYIFNLFYFSILTANIIQVPEDYLSIQNAIDNSMQNDTILVNSGTYTENIIIDNLEIFLISSNGPQNTIIDGDFNGSTINIDSPGNHVLINGFTIKNGIGKLLDSGSRFGGGIISHNTTLTLDSLIIENNEAFAGGGICIYNNSSSETESILKNSTIQNNTASEGGGIFIINQSLNIHNTIIDNNGMLPYGSGGGIQALVANISIVDVNITNNHSRFGGGIYLGSSDAYIEKSIVSNNLSDSKGGGIWLGSNSQLNLQETLITNNIADGFGGGIFISLSNLNINQSTISHNIVSSTTSGAGIYADGGNAIIQNSIIYFNRQEESESINYNLNGYSANYLMEYEVEYSDIEGSEDWIPDGIGVISNNPEFAVDSYYLSENSPCIDAGNPNYYDPDGTILDLGIYYYNQHLCHIIGDLNQDNYIDILDIIELINIILDINNTYDICHDINNDQHINILDILTIINLILDE